MPRVTQAHLNARRHQILVAAHRCFAENGFHRTTMDDVAAEAGISVGTLYRYFDGKEALIEALADMGRAQKKGALDSLRSEGGIEALSSTVGNVVNLLDMDGVDDAVRLDVRLWGEALNHESLLKVLRGSLNALREPLEKFIAHEIGQGRIREDVDADAVARIIVAMLMGMEVQRLYDPEMNIRGCSEAMAVLLQGLASD